MPTSYSRNYIKSLNIFSDVLHRALGFIKLSPYLKSSPLKRMNGISQNKTLGGVEL